MGNKSPIFKQAITLRRLEDRCLLALTKTVTQAALLKLDTVYLVIVCPGFITCGIANLKPR